MFSFGPSFVQDSDVDVLVSAGRNALTRQHGDSTWTSTQAYSTVFFDAEDYSSDEYGKVLQRLEDRIARLTMIGQHPDEGSLMFTRQLPGVQVGSIIENQVIRNVHHDKNMRERRAVTVLIYLSSAAPGTRRNICLVLLSLLR